MKKNFDYIRKVLIVICIALIGYSGFQIYSFFGQFKAQDDDDEKLITEIRKTEGEDNKEEKKDDDIFTPDASTYAILNAINSDYRGWLKWDSNIISTPILQSSTDSSYYLNHNIYKNEVIGGAAFIDANTSLDSQNIPLYGHSVFYSYSQTTGQMFSRLRDLGSQDFYENNKTFKIYWENEVDTYEVYAVDEIDISKDRWAYEQTDFNDENEFNEWIKHAEDNNVIRPDFNVNSDDKLITFQTCKYREGKERIIVVAKKIEAKVY